MFNSIDVAMKAAVLRRTCCLLALLLGGGLIPTTARAQQSGYYLQSFASPDAGERLFLRSVMDQLADSLQARGWQEDEDEGWMFLVDATQRDAGDLVALSIGVFARLPEALVQEGKQREAFFVNVSDDTRATFTEEGKWVRERVSEDYMRQFVMPQDQYIAIVAFEDLGVAIGEALTRFRARHMQE